MAGIGWIYLKQNIQNATSGSTYFETMSTSKPETVLAREVIQNSVDARVGRETPKVDFHFVDRQDVSGMINDDFVRHARAANLNFDINVQAAPVLFVEDFNTTGLTGTLQSRSSRLSSLILSLGGSEKMASSGGSYGFGKAGAILNSGIRALVAYSVRPEGSALVGAAYFGHYKLNHEYSGRALFGRVSDDPEETREIEDDEADKLALALGIPRARSQEQGTTLMLVAPVSSPEELKEEIETSWWPRLTDRGLDVEIWHKGVRFVPRPGARSDLKTFVELYRLIHKERSALPHEFVNELIRQRKRYGVVAFSAQEQAVRHTDDEPNRLNTVALMRGLGMVVDYHKLPESSDVPLQGVFVADQSIDDDLRMTEDPKHSSWSEEASRGGGQGHLFAREIRLGIRGQARKIREGYRPNEDDPDLALQPLKRFLGSMFGHTGESGPVGQPEDIKVSPWCDIEAVKGGLRVVGRATIVPGTTSAPYLKISVQIMIPESFTSRVGDPVTAQILGPGGESDTGSSPTILVPIESSKAIEVEFVSEPYPYEWTANARVSAEYAGRI